MRENQGSPRIGWSQVSGVRQPFNGTMLGASRKMVEDLPVNGSREKLRIWNPSTLMDLGGVVAPLLVSRSNVTALITSEDFANVDYIFFYKR